MAELATGEGKKKSPPEGGGGRLRNEAGIGVESALHGEGVLEFLHACFSFASLLQALQVPMQ